MDERRVVLRVVVMIVEIVEVDGWGVCVGRCAWRRRAFRSQRQRLQGGVSAEKLENGHGGMM